MKFKKATSLALCLTLILGAAACNTSGSNTTVTIDTTVAQTIAQTESEPVETETSEPEETVTETVATQYLETDVNSNPEDTGEELKIYSYSDDFKRLLQDYCSDISYTYESFGGDAEYYQSILDSVLGTEDAPDIFICDIEYLDKYINSEYTRSVNSVGIQYSELDSMFDYTLQLASDDNNVIKGIAWEVYPCGVFYNRSLAEEYLGVSEPDDVAAYFADWDAVTETARTINTASEGEAKLFGGIDDIWNSYRTQRCSTWYDENGYLRIDPAIDEFYNLGRIFADEELTLNTTMWTNPWNDAVKYSDVMTIWGSLSVFNYHISLRNISSTEGNWGLVNAPNSFTMGGEWILISDNCDMDASVAAIIRALTMNNDNMLEMVDDDIFVNSVDIITDCAADINYGMAALGGQNPYLILLDAALEANYSQELLDDDYIDAYFLSSVRDYMAGDASSVEDAHAQLNAILFEQSIFDN